MFLVKSRNATRSGDLVTAMEASNAAKTRIILSIVLGLIIWPLVIVGLYQLFINFDDGRV